VGAVQRSREKRLKPFYFVPRIHTRLKPGANENKIQLQETELRSLVKSSVKTN
jgi:hypothetical protein